MEEETLFNPDTAVRWYALRDLKRPNAKVKAYEELGELGYEVFTPLRWEATTTAGKRERRRRPVVSDLLFVHTSRHTFDAEIARRATLQYRYARGSQASPMVVPDSDMSRFITAVSLSSDPEYYLPEEITPSMYGREVRIVGGPLDGYTGHLLTAKGRRHKRLLVRLPGLLSVAIEVSPSYLQLL